MCHALGADGVCHIERDGVAIANSVFAMGETDPTTSGGYLNFGGITVVSSGHTTVADYEIACWEGIGDIDFADLSLSALTIPG